MDEDPASPADNSPYDEASRMVKRERPTSPSSTKSASLPNVSQQRKWGGSPWIATYVCIYAHVGEVSVASTQLAQCLFSVDLVVIIGLSLQ